MNNQAHNTIVSFIWGIADDCLRDVYVRGKYRDVILPMTVIRRLDALLEQTKQAVLDMKKMLDAAEIDNQWPALCNAAGQAFCNASPFLLRDLTSRAKRQTLKADFEAYLDGFSPNVQEILEKFKFRNQIDTMIDADILGAVIEKFISPDINLSPNPVYKDDARTIIKHPGLDNHGMGTIFEESRTSISRTSIFPVTVSEIRRILNSCKLDISCVNISSYFFALSQNSTMYSIILACSSSGGMGRIMVLKSSV